MRTTVTEQQTAFFTKNGFIEFEIPHPPLPTQGERDAWRKDPKLQEFLTRTLGRLALTLTGKKELALLLDQRIAEENKPAKPCPLKEMFCIQGITIAVAIADNPIEPAKRSPLGILPLPAAGHLLFFRPELILDWPHISSAVYLAAFGLPNAVYVHNPKDPATHFLKQFGYNFGDVLKNSTHPRIV